MGAQGRSASGDDWRNGGIVFDLGGGGGGSPAPPPPPPTPPPPTTSPSPTPPPTPPPSDLTPVTIAIAGAPDGWDTYQLAVTLSGDAANVYTTYGTAISPMTLPAAYQCATPFGGNTGGTNAAFWAIANNAALGYAQFDSWLTVGITDGDATGQLGNIGIDFTAWTGDAGISVDDGAVFWMSPDDGPAAGTDAVVAQLTVTAGSAGTASMGMQGRSVAGDDWQADNIAFTYP